MTPDGAHLFFAAERADTLGEADIYLATWDAFSGTWSAVEHLGPNINSSENDIMPFFCEADQHLYFASDRIVPRKIFSAKRSTTEFVRGDCDGSGSLNVADAIFLLTHVFEGTTTPTCSSSCDGNDDGEIDIGDAVGLLALIFVGGFPPAPPYPDCGADLTADDLECNSFDACSTVAGAP